MFVLTARCGAGGRGQEVLESGDDVRRESRLVSDATPVVRAWGVVCGVWGVGCWVWGVVWGLGFGAWGVGLEAREDLCLRDKEHKC
jgi:hypothetical protein